MDVPEVTRKKAELIHTGKIFVPDSMELPYPLSSSTAGPGAGRKALALSFGGTRLKLGLTKDENARFSLAEDNGSYRILEGAEVFVEDVKIIPTLLHAPNQAFVNLREGCIYGCRFCATPDLKDGERKNKSPGQAVEMILQAARSRDFQSVAITSGVVGSPEETVREMVDVVGEIRRNLADVDIGVEPYVENTGDIDRLHHAGATEIKINIESFDRDIFDRICPDLDFDHILAMLEHAVAVFGRGKVTSNILIGLGETDENVRDGIEHLAGMGVVPVIRVLRINDSERIAGALGHEIEKVKPERMLGLARAQKEILEKHGLSTGTFATMCHRCGCCDIVPFKDI